MGTRVDDRYIIESLLGEGSMAEVYKVKHLQLGTYHALKVLKLDHDSIQERMLREGQFQAKLRHKNIVSVTDVVKVDKDAGLVMEYIDGGSMAELLANHRLTPEQVDHLARGLLAGVEAAHAAGYIHRDLKPANILLAREGKQLVPKITDFGLAKAMDSSNTLTKSGVMMGTPAYMAPEQIQDAKYVDQRADLFSVGAILYHLVAGRRPFDDQNIANVLGAVLDGKYPPLSKTAPHLPKHQARAIEAALTVDLDQRVPTCAVLTAMWEGTFNQDTSGMADHETTEGPFGSALMASLAPAQPSAGIENLATVIRHDTPAPAPRRGGPKSKSKPKPKPKTAQSPVMMGAMVVGLFLLLGVATIVGFGLGSILLLVLRG